MTKTRAKLSWEGGDVAPFPRSPVSLGAGKKNSKAASVPIETVSFEGCSRKGYEQIENRILVFSCRTVQLGLASRLQIRVFSLLGIRDFPVLPSRRCYTYVVGEISDPKGPCP